MPRPTSWKNCNRTLKFKVPTIAEITHFLLNHPLWLGIVRYTKENSFIGFQGVPIYDVLVFVYHEVMRDDLFTRANSVAFSFFLSLFPSVLTIFTFLPFVFNILEVWYPNINNFNATLDEEISRVMPGQAGEFVLAFVQEITNSPRLGLLSFGFLLALYFSSNGMIALMQAFEKSYVKTFKRRNLVRKRLIATGLTLLVGLFIVASVVFVILGDEIIYWMTGWLDLSSVTSFFLGFFRWIIMLLLYYVIIGTVYRYGAATIKKFSYFSPGVTLAAVLSLLTSVAFSFYIDGFDRYDTYIKFYGSIATIIIFMLWLQFNALILIIGFELNAAIAVRRDLTLAPEEE